MMHSKLVIFVDFRMWHDLTLNGIFTFSTSANVRDHFYEWKLELFDKVNVDVRIDFMHPNQ